MQKNIGDTKTERVKREIIKYILENKINPNQILPSEGQIADQYGVSKMTSKLALNALVEEEIIYRVPRQGSFLKTDDMAKLRILLDKKENTSKMTNYSYLALVIPVIDFYTGRIIKEFTDVAKQANYQVVIRVSNGISDEEEAILKELAGISSIKGVVLFPGDKNICGVELLQYKMKNYPIVMVDRVFREIEFDSVYHDHYQGAKEMVEYLIDHGHSKIGFVSYNVDEITSREERYRAYKDTLEEAEIPINKSHILIEDVQPEHQDLVTYLNNNQDLTAVFCGDDYLAIRLYYAAYELNLKIPEDLSIVGFTDNEILACLNISLTTVRQPVKELAVETFKILEAKINLKNCPIKHIKIPTKIIERQSVKKI